MNHTTDGRTLFTSRCVGNHVVVNTTRTGDAPGPLMGDVIAVSPVRNIAIAARIGSGPFADRAYGCVDFGPWVELGPSSQPQGVAWIDGRFVFAHIGPGGASLNEIVIIDRKPIFASTRLADTSQGILCRDARGWVIKSNSRETTIKDRVLINAVQRGDWWFGQATRPDRGEIVHAVTGQCWTTGASPEHPVFTVIGDRLIVNGPVEFTPPYGPKIVVPVPPPVVTPPVVIPPVPQEPPVNVINRLDVVQGVNRDYPGLIVSDPAGFSDQVAHRLNRIDGIARWGRKARNRDGSNPNLDVVTYLVDSFDASKKKLIDVIGNSESPDAKPTWQLRPASEEAGNGYWRLPVSEDRDDAAEPVPLPTPAPTPTPVPRPTPKFDKLAERFTKQETRLDDLGLQLAAIEGTLRALTTATIDVVNKTKPPQAYTGRVLGQNFTLTPKV